MWREGLWEWGASANTRTPAAATSTPHGGSCSTKKGQRRRRRWRRKRKRILLLPRVRMRSVDVGDLFSFHPHIVFLLGSAGGERTGSSHRGSGSSFSMKGWGGDGFIHDNHHTTRPPSTTTHTTTTAMSTTPYRTVIPTRGTLSYAKVWAALARMRSSSSS